MDKNDKPGIEGTPFTLKLDEEWMASIILDKMRALQILYDVTRSKIDTVLKEEMNKQEVYTDLERPVGPTNSAFIGIDAGRDLTSGDEIVIIGDGITSLDHSQENVVFIGDKVAIGKTVFGIPCNLYDIIIEHILKQK